MTAAVITTVPEEDDVYPGIPDEVYHADRGSLSSSGARTILWGTPAKFEDEQKSPPPAKKEYDFGHVAHLLILGEGSKVAVLDPAVHGLTDDGKPAKSPKSTSMWKKADAEARERGEVPISVEDYETAKVMAAKVLEHPQAAALLSQGDPEISGFWHDQATGVRLRWRADWLHPGRTRLIIVDYKTTKSAHPTAFHKSCAEYGYHQQEAWYRDGAIANGLCDDPLFLFIAQEKTSPFLVSVHESKPEDIERARQLNRIAIDRYARCRETGIWPGYGDGIHTINHPAYSVYREQDLLK